MRGVDDIKTFKAISNHALQGATLPSRLKVFGWGDNQTIDGIYRAGQKTASQMSANQRKLGYERVAIDFDHCTVPGSATQKELLSAGQPPLIFGYGRVNPIAGDGIYLEEITWTPLGAQHARNFEDLSPALKDDDREVTMIHSVALCPNGKVNGLQFFSAGATPASTKPTPNMSDKFLSLSAVAGILGLDANAEEAAVLAKLKTAMTPAAPAAVDLTPLSARLTTLEAKLTATEAATAAAAAEQVIRTFSADGKVPKKADGTNYSAEELKKLDLPTLQILAANTPVTVALSARTQGRPEDTKKTHRDAKGIVDLASVFEEENKKVGLSLTPNI